MGNKCCGECRRYDDFKKNIEAGIAETYCANPKCKCHQEPKTQGVEEVRQELYRLCDKVVINQRAVDQNTLSPQERDNMNMSLFDLFLNRIETLLTEQREAGRVDAIQELSNDETWEERKNEYILKWMQLFGRYFNERAAVCEDCGGPLWHICERNMRDFTSKIADACRREILASLDAARTKKKEDITH